MGIGNHRREPADRPSAGRSLSQAPVLIPPWEDGFPPGARGHGMRGSDMAMPLTTCNSGLVLTPGHRPPGQTLWARRASQPPRWVRETQELGLAPRGSGGPRGVPSPLGKTCTCMDSECTCEGGGRSWRPGQACGPAVRATVVNGSSRVVTGPGRGFGRGQGFRSLGGSEQAPTAACFPWTHPHPSSPPPGSELWVSAAQRLRGSSPLLCLCSPFPASVTEDPGVLPKRHQVAGGDPGEGQEAERATEGQQPPSAQPEPEGRPTAWHRPRLLEPGPLGGLPPALCPRGPTCLPRTAVQEGRCPPEPLLIDGAPVLPQVGGQCSAAASGGAQAAGVCPQGLSSLCVKDVRWALMGPQPPPTTLSPKARSKATWGLRLLFQGGSRAPPLPCKVTCP